MCRKTRRFLKEVIILIVATYVLSLAILITGFIVATVILKKKNMRWLKAIAYVIEDNDMEDIVMATGLFLLFAFIGLFPVLNIAISIIVAVALSCFAYKGVFE